MATKHLTTLGFGNGTFSGSIALVTLLGYTTSAASVGDFCFEAVSFHTGGADAAGLQVGGPTRLALHVGGAEDATTECG